MAGELILIVEDNDKNRKLERDVLQFHGYQTAEAESAEDGIQLARASTPALILMDLSLPKLDGLAATRQIRRHEGLGNTPIVAISAHDSPESRTEALEAGCDEYVTKPIDFDQLGELVKRFLPKGNYPKQETRH